MSHHDHKCWNCGHKYDTVKFYWICPDCQAKFNDDPKVIEHNELLIKQRLEEIQALKGEIVGTRTRIRRRPREYTGFIDQVRDALADEPVAIYHSRPDIPILDENGNPVPTEEHQYTLGIDPIATTQDSVENIMEQLNNEELRHDNDEQLPF